MATQTTADAAPLALTGERTLPGIPDENYWFRRHEAAYLALAPFCLGAVVVDAGSGEGYGASLLAAVSSRVIALDYDAAASAHAGRTYPEVCSVRGDVQRLPVGSRTVDVVASLQVVEHSWDQRGLLAECARVLRPAGTLLLTTPNRTTFSPDSRPGEHPANPFHTRELTAGELVDLLAPDFVVTRLLGLHHGRRLRRYERRHGPVVNGQLAGPPDTWPYRLRRLVHTVHAADFTVTGEAVDAALDLVVVARRRTSADS